MKPKRRTSSEASQKYWKAVDRIVSARNAQKEQIRVGEPWTDTKKDLSASLISDLPTK